MVTNPWLHCLKISPISYSPIEEDVLCSRSLPTFVHLCPKPSRQHSMAPGKVRPRRDSYGLEVRPDGTLVMGPPVDILHRGSEVVRVTSREGAGGGRNNSSLPRQEFFGSRQVLSSLMMKKKKKQRRDSFGLVVREDGTISLEQLSRMNNSHSPEPSPSLSNSRIGLADDSERRELSSQASRDFRDSGHHNWRNSLQRTVRGRRDSFGLEVREDGTLSLERLIVNTRDEEEIERRRQSRPLQTSPARLGAPTSLPYEPGSRRCHSGPSHNIASENATSITGPRSSSTRGVGSRQQRRVLNPTSSNHTEVELLRERVQRLEAELASRSRLPAHSSVEAPPAYEPRRGSPQRQVGNTARTSR